MSPPVSVSRPQRNPRWLLLPRGIFSRSGAVLRVVAFATVLCGTANLSPGEVGIHVTGQARVVNGASEVPVGLFGVHATPLTPETMADWGVEAVRLIEQTPSGKPVLPGAGKEAPTGVKMIVECFFDRYQPAVLLADRAWKEKLEKLARSYAENARKTSFVHTIEFWNEPYLNWSVKPGVNYDGAFYQPGPEGAPMTIKGGSKPLDSLVWSKQLVAVDPETGRVDYLASSYALPLVWKKELKESDDYVFRGTKKYRIESRPWGKDPGQTAFFAGPQNSAFYRWMFVPFAKALKETNPNVQLVGGWGFNINQDDWAAWPTLFKPLIDDSIRWLDGIDEHHYGGDTRKVAGTYEVVSAYAQSTYGKRLKFYNTEAGGAFDPERPDAPAAPNFQANSGPALIGAFTYMVRDVLHLIDECPDKAVSRASHMAHANGDRFGLKFLKELRGRLLSVESGVANVWCVASVENARLCVVVFNDNAKAQTFPLRADAPRGWNFVSGAEESPVRNANTIDFAARDVSAKGGVFETSVELPGKSARKWVFTCQPGPVITQKRVETQYYAAGVINRLSPVKPVELEVRIPADALKVATMTQLKIVQEGWNGDCSCTLNGHELKLEISNTWTHHQSIDPALLQPVNKLVFQTRSHSPVTIDMASIVTVTQPSPE